MSNLLKDLGFKQEEIPGFVACYLPDFDNVVLVCRKDQTESGSKPVKQFSWEKRASEHPRHIRTQFYADNIDYLYDMFWLIGAYEIVLKQRNGTSV